MLVRLEQNIDSIRQSKEGQKNGANDGSLICKILEALNITDETYKTSRLLEGRKTGATKRNILSHSESDTPLTFRELHRPYIQRRFQSISVLDSAPI